MERDGGPRFDRAVAPGGYAWWYVDALSQDRAFGLTIIAFIGSVFSPYYIWSGRVDPLDHCAVNVGLYGPRGKRWAMTERARSSLSRAANSLAIGRSALEWRAGGLEIDIDEVCVPLPTRIRGRVRIEPAAVNAQSFALDARGRHAWRPIVPSARVTVDLERPALRWRGEGYFDMNAGDEPLENGFDSWTWSRAALSPGATILYEASRRDGGDLALAMRFDAAGRCEPFTPPPVAALPNTCWRIARQTRSDEAASVERTFEDTPFYARSLVSSTLLRENVVSVHESLSLTRFSNPIVRLMLPFRMPRRSGSQAPHF